MMTSSEVAALKSTTPTPAPAPAPAPGLHVLPRSIPEAFAALTPIASVLLDSTCNILQVSARYLTFNDLTSDDCIGRNVFHLVKSKALVPGLVSLQLVIDRAIETKNVAVTSTSEYRDGRPFFSSLRAVPIFEHDVLLYMLLEVQDTTAEHERRVALNDQLDTNDTYKVLVDTVKDYAIFMLDTKGNVRTWNAGAALLKGYKPEEIIGKHFSIFYGEEDKIAEKPRKELDICLRESKVEDEGWRYKKDGTRFWANVSLISQSMIPGVSCLVRCLSYSYLLRVKQLPRTLPDSDFYFGRPILIR
jgi:osomolarity two-component system sensor histidine kinase TcsA